VQLFLRHRGEVADGSSPGRAWVVRDARFAGASPADLLARGQWAWHDLEDVARGERAAIPEGSVVVWTFNGKAATWGPGHEFDLAIAGAEGDHQRRFSARVPIARPGRSLAALTFLGPDDAIRPDRMVVHIHHEEGSRPIRFAGVRLYLPRDPRRWRVLEPRPEIPPAACRFLPGTGRIDPGDHGVLSVATGPLPLTYAAVEVRMEEEGGAAFSLWAWQRIKREAFDISGGWVADGTPRGNTLTLLPYLKTLKRLHVNAGQIQDVPGYTDQDGPDGLYARYPLKLFNRLMPLERFDTDALLPRIHAVEFLGEPQYGGSRSSRTPQQVHDELLPYASSRLATTVTLSDESTWRLYAGLSDYPHYDAYRVSAPSADAWGKYDRWDGAKIYWGAPLETIGDLCRSLNAGSRPAPTACWSQGPHDWEVYGGRKRCTPTPEEIRLQAYHALSSRITSLYWFNLSLRALTAYRDTLEELGRVGREIRMLDRFQLEGVMTSYRRATRDGRVDWDLSVVSSPRAALLFALDLAYRPDPVEKVFRFGPPRPATFEFPLPSYLRRPRDVFRVDAEGIHPVTFAATGTGVEIRDTVSKVGLYVATGDPDLRGEIASRRLAIVHEEQALDFNPARNDADFATLKGLLDPTR
jgi:hypothetical protein